MPARIDAKQAEYQTDIAMLAKEMAERENRMLRAMATMIGIGVAVLGAGMAALKYLP